MIIKINRQKTINKFPKLPLRHYDTQLDEDVFNNPKTFSNYVLTLPSKFLKRPNKLLGIQLVLLAKSLEFSDFTFLGDEDIPWLRRLHTYKEFQKDLQYLINYKIGKRFSGALQVSIREIPIFIKHLANLVQTNGILPYVHFIDPEQNIIGSICQYGNVHISTMNKKSDKELKSAVAKTLFTYTIAKNCGLESTEML